MLESWKAVTLPAETQCQVKTVSMFQQQNHSFPVMFAKMSGQSHRHSFRTYIAFYTTFGILVLSICLHRIPETNLLCQINLHFKVNLLIWHSPGYYPWIPGQAFCQDTDMWVFSQLLHWLAHQNKVAVNVKYFWMPIYLTRRNWDSELAQWFL